MRLITIITPLVETRIRAMFPAISLVTVTNMMLRDAKSQNESAM